MNALFEQVEKYYSYREFVDLVEELVKKGKTTGKEQTPSLIEYTKLNAQRMRRVSKTTKLSEELVVIAKNQQKQIWWVITESWCGDGAQIIPALDLIAEASDNVEMRIILRDDNLPVMDQYLTNGSRSVPKLIALDDRGQELFVWGPRPKGQQDFVMEWKKDHKGVTGEEMKQELHKRYAKDRSKAILEEFTAIMQ